MSSGFQLSGSGPESYEACWVSAQMGKCAEELVEAATVDPGDRVLDVGCGTGVVAREAAKRNGYAAGVTGTDINEDMLTFARKFAEKNSMPAITWRQCDAAAMPFPEESFDVVLCQQGLQFMPDRPGAMAEMARVLIPGGRLALSAWRSQSPFGLALSKVLDGRFGDGTTAPWQAVYSLGDRVELRTLAENAGFEGARVYYDIKMLRYNNPEEFVLGALSGSPLANDFSVLTFNEREQIVADIVSALDNYRDDYGLAIPADCHTLTATKPALIMLPSGQQGKSALA